MVSPARFACHSCHAVPRNARTGGYEKNILLVRAYHARAITANEEPWKGKQECTSKRKTVHQTTLGDALTSGELFLGNTSSRAMPLSISSSHRMIRVMTGYGVILSDQNKNTMLECVRCPSRVVHANIAREQAGFEAQPNPERTS